MFTENRHYHLICVAIATDVVVDWLALYNLGD